MGCCFLCYLVRGGLFLARLLGQLLGCLESVDLGLIRILLQYVACLARAVL